LILDAAATSSSTIKSSGPADSDPEGNDEIDTNTEECIELKPEFEFPCPTNVPGLGKDTKLKISLEMIGSRASDLHTFMTRHFLWKEADWKYLKVSVFNENFSHSTVTFLSSCVLMQFFNE